ncbi:hypothetical protein H0E87_022045 [Populus deltoides]|uniref:Uncharacterized protein n=1 Tax=Populus deltoides TaxID=3696 RepID=A0A8T2XIS4_POPDE|nr:hypothetical protein H0E87_022045 [Populus deltoides]
MTKRVGGCSSRTLPPEEKGTAGRGGEDRNSRAARACGSRRGCFGTGSEEGKTGRRRRRPVCFEKRGRSIAGQREENGGIWRIGCGLEKESSLWECLEMAPVSGEKSGWNG